MLLIVAVFLLANISFVSSYIDQGCPIVGGYYTVGSGTYYECRTGGDYYKQGIDWYTLDDSEKFDNIGGSEVQNDMTESWIRWGEFKIKGKEEQIKSKGIALEEFSEETIKLNFVTDDAFFKLYDDTFTTSHKRVRLFCKEFKKRNIGWRCWSRRGR